jgi:hypothetical protein
MKNFTTPKGAAGYSNLTKPDTKFDAEGKYKTTLTISKEAAEALIAVAHEEAEELLENVLNAPVKGKKPAKLKKLDDLTFPFEENDDDTVTFTFKSKKKPKLFDAKGNPIRDDDLRVGAGSTIRVKGAFSGYEGFGGGVTAYLNEVQIVKLVEFGGGGFEADEDEEDAYVAPSGGGKASADEGQFDGDVEF